MKGDFSNITFNAQKHFRRVLMQQGRVQLDADWNEQTSILLHYLQNLTKDIIGAHGGPAKNLGFALTTIHDSNKNFTDLKIGRGHYYVAGILCENEKTSVTYKNQPNYQRPQDEKLPKLPFLVYLDVWERDITTIEDPEIQEVALGGADTTTRSQIVWQVKIKDFSREEYGITVEETRDYNTFIERLGKDIKPRTGLLSARVKKSSSANSNDPCTISPNARYRGIENQLYRVEIHQGSNSSKHPTFKWSRDNGSVIFPIQHLSGNTVTLEHLGRESRFSLKVGDWVEIVDEDYVLQGRTEPLLQVDKIDPIERKVTLKGSLPANIGQNPEKYPLLRRWDSPGEIPVTVPTTNDGWIELEDGIEVKFQANGFYKSGDYWLIPARTATGGINWPTKKVKDENGNLVTVPEELRPRSVQHYYAPIAIIAESRNGRPEVHDCRLKFYQLAQ